MRSSTGPHRLTRMVVGSVVATLVLAPVDVVGSSTPAGDQPEQPPELTASVSPTVIAPDGQLTVSSIDPCPESEHEVRVNVMYGPEGWNETEGGGTALFEDTFPIEDDGSWSVTVPGPATIPLAPEGPRSDPDPEGLHNVEAQCVSEGEDGLSDLLAEYTPVDFEVVRAEPARPVVDEPELTG
jgi:hypothetical protein